MKKITVTVILSTLLIGCATNQESHENQKQDNFVYELKKSYLSGGEPVQEATEPEDTDDEGRKKDFEPLKSITADQKEEVQQQRIAETFSAQEKATIAAENMPLTEFLHYAFGEILSENYVVAPDLKNNKTPVTANVKEPVSKRELFNIIASVLKREQVSVDYDNGTFFFQAAKLGKAKAAIGIGNTPESVPNTSGQILQVVPIKYGIKVALERTVRELISATIRADFEQSSLFVMGDRSNVLRALELIDILDTPANRGKHIGLITLTYIPLNEFVNQTKTLMENEGLNVGVNTGSNSNIALVPLEHLGSAAVFATSEELLDRVKYWATILDQPTRGESEQYFVYNPKYARATDLGKSIGDLISLGSRSTVSKNQRSTGANAEELRNTGDSGSTLVSAEKMSFVVDERSNSIIFRTSGSQYQTLLPLLRKLDVLPKQVLLEVLIAEVTMADDFKYGVEFALKNSSRLSVTTQGSFGAGETGGLNLSFLDGGAEAVASFFKENKFINVLSNPSLLVRDGVAANISVGTDIPVVGGTVSQDGGNVTTNIEYRKTGVDVSVTPTINAQGVVIMSINQRISNTVDTTAGSNGSPSIFERSLDTEAVVGSGKTVLLGGLISEDVSNGETKVPGFGDLPLVGHLFKGRTDSRSKTELVMLVTPKVIESNEQWNKLMSDFEGGLENIRLIR
ncbi:Type II secretion system protein [Saliniradius amylolyticus]|uniref:Type II secretion system protein n=1 Tax=Saliniradius amylolyticus TaxID=2183582 RepID=A0A2S2E0P3_9ALTE|nr:secretin N-terminal domain-containing protein [Saliniradius amylolyticus]AWL11214.1 Type II secretion system protein [Saliniradius amylolyticus]